MRAVRDEWLLAGSQEGNMECGSVPGAECHVEQCGHPVVGHTGLWRFYEKDVSSYYRNVRFQVFRTVTNDTNQLVNFSQSGNSTVLAKSWASLRYVVWVDSRKAKESRQALIMFSKSIAAGGELIKMRSAGDDLLKMRTHQASE